MDERAAVRLMSHPARWWGQKKKNEMKKGQNLIPAGLCSPKAKALEMGQLRVGQDRTGGSEPRRSSFVALLGLSPASGCPGKCSTVSGLFRTARTALRSLESGVKLPQKWSKKTPLLMWLQPELG